MKHSIRQRVLDPVTGLMVTKIETVNGELGSGIVDKNGREIFEGDLVNFWARSPKNDGMYDILSTKVVFDDGALWLYITDENYLQSRPLYKLENPPSFDRNLLPPVPQRLEVIGHADD